MNPDTIIASVTAIGVAGLGGLFSYLIARKARQFSRLKKKYVAACEQIEAYHYIEGVYRDEVAILTGQSARQVLLAHRDEAEGWGYARPIWTAREAREEIERYS